MNLEAAKTILLVEDEAIIAMEEKMALSRYHYDIITAYSGEKAIEIFEDNCGKIDLILMDIDLGKGMDGTEAAKRILSKKEIPVVFLTSHEEPEIVRKTEKITSYGYVVKNSSITVLNASIKMAMKLFTEKSRVKEQKQQLATVNKKLTSTNKALEFTQKKLLDREKELLTREGRFNQAQQLAKIGHWNLDILNNKLEWSDEIYRIFELDPEEFCATYEAFLELVHPEDRETVHQAYQDSLVTKSPYEIVHRIKLKTGKVKQIHEKCVTEFDSQENPVFSIGTVQDISNNNGNAS